MILHNHLHVYSSCAESGRASSFPPSHRRPRPSGCPCLRLGQDVLPLPLPVLHMLLGRSPLRHALPLLLLQSPPRDLAELFPLLQQPRVPPHGCLVLGLRRHHLHLQGQHRRRTRTGRPPIAIASFACRAPRSTRQQRLPGLGRAHPPPARRDRALHEAPTGLPQGPSAARRGAWRCLGSYASRRRRVPLACCSHTRADWSGGTTFRALCGKLLGFCRRLGLFDLI